MKSPEEIYSERIKRVEDAIALKTPDRIPIVFLWGFFPAYYYGITCKEYMYDHEKAMDVAIRLHEEFQTDMAENPFGARVIGETMEALDYKQLRWPGYNLRSDMGYQFVEDVYMNAEEYDHFIEDPSDYTVRVYWPRIFGKMTGFSKLPSLKTLNSYILGLPYGLSAFASEEVQEAMEALKKAGEASAKSLSFAMKYAKSMAEKGFPMRDGGVTQAPFDTLGDFFRGTKEIMMDMYRRPEKLKKALEVLTPWMLNMGISGGKATGNPRIFIPLHKGSDSFMSEDQFKEFYWPTLKDLIEGLVDEGMNPVLFVESDHTKRLEIMRDVPTGKVVYHMEGTDMAKAKEILGDRVCLRGGFPISLLCTGSLDEVERECKKLIDIAGKDGGYIMDAGVPLDDAKPENVKKLIETTLKYGQY